LAAQANGPLLISGCQSDETSADVLIDRDYHGALTYALVKSVKEARGRTTYRQLMQEVRRLLPTYGTRQTPQLDGPPTRLVRLFITQARPAGAVRPRAGTRGPASKPRRRHRRTRSPRP
jgi:Caspase domain